MARFFKWLAITLLVLPVVFLILISIFGLNWARGPIQRITAEKTGRTLVIGGDLKAHLAWPAPVISAENVSFSNPSWAKEPQMVTVDKAEFSIDVPDLLVKRLTFPEVRLTHPAVFLELAADGRKTWLLDKSQSDESARIPIGRLMLDHGKLGYDDAQRKTSIRAEISTTDMQQDAQKNAPKDAANSGISFEAKGIYQGLALTAKGRGGSVLALNDEKTPYPLQLSGAVGRTRVKIDGTITSLLKFSALHVQLALSGDSLAQLYPLLGITLPDTYPYATNGHLVRQGKSWRYENFSGHLGKSDIGGNLMVDTGGKRSLLRAQLNSELLDFSDLGPLIGAKKTTANVTATPVVAKTANAGKRVLPDIPFQTERWNSVDADVSLKAKKIQRAEQLPIEDLALHLKMQDSVLTLDPLDFGLAGGHLKAVIVLDGKQHPIDAHAKISARKLQLAKLFPTIKLNNTSVGEINGEFDLAGKGDSVGGMLASANGRATLIIANGEISKLMMEASGLHVLEVLQLALGGDKTIKLRCGVADFSVKSGVMDANTLFVDTDVNTVLGKGDINLGQEKLDLTLEPKTRSTSPVALRTPIYIQGTFADPQVKLDKTRLALRGGGALALAVVNPLLILIPLVEMGPGVESECGRYIQQATTSTTKPEPQPKP